MSDIVAACDGQGAPSNATTLQRYTDNLDPYECRILFPHCAWLCANAERGRAGSGGLEVETTTPAEAATVPTLDGEEPEEEEPEEDEENPSDIVNHDDDDDDDDDDINDQHEHNLDTTSLRQSLRDHSR
jgi:hypothetical protein